MEINMKSLSEKARESIDNFHKFTEVTHTLVDTSKWGCFKLGGEKGLFNIVKGKRLTKANMIEGDINFIGSSAENNGITNHISNSENLHKGNLITVSYNGSVGEAFYQEEPFVASDDVNVFYPNFEMNKYIALYLCAIIRKEGKKYAFINKWKKEEMEETKIFLPTKHDGSPNWKYMETYMKSLKNKADKTIKGLQQVNTSKYDKIDISRWKEFPISDFFDFSLPKGDLQVKKVTEGEIPLITPSNTNNGLLQRISASSESTLYDKNTLTVDMFGNAYYHEEKYFVTAHGHVNVLLPKIKINKHIGLFLASTIKKMFMNKYGFSDMCTQKVLKKEVITIPIDDSGNPDWNYMEEYMKKIEMAANKNVTLMI